MRRPHAPCTATAIMPSPVLPSHHSRPSSPSASQIADPRPQGVVCPTRMLSDLLRTLPRFARIIEIAGQPLPASHWRRRRQVRRASGAKNSSLRQLRAGAPVSSLSFPHHDTRENLDDTLSLSGLALRGFAASAAAPAFASASVAYITAIHLPSCEPYRPHFPACPGSSLWAGTQQRFCIIARP